MAGLTAEALNSSFRDWLESHVDGWSDVTVKRLNVVLSAGNSAETVLVDVGYTDPCGRYERSLVVRGQPTDFEVVPGSSLMLQYEMMAALRKWGGVPVPACLSVELDPAILGMPFLVMGKVDGHPAANFPNYNLVGWVADMTPAQRFEAWKNGIQGFAKLDALDWRGGFGFLARADRGEPGIDQYVGDLVAWRDACAKGRPMLYIDAALDHIRTHKPRGVPVNVLWGDATPANVMFGDDGVVNAMIDWELAALGPSELDLAWWLYFDDFFSRSVGVQRLEGLPTRSESIEIWQAAVGREAKNLDYYDIVVGLRMALVMVGAFDRQVGRGNIGPDNASLNVNPMTIYLAEKLGMRLPDVGPDFHEFMSHVMREK